MFLITLVFFGPPLLGALIQHRLRRILPSIYNRVLIVTIIVGFAYVTIALTLPFYSLVSEVPCVLLGVCAMALVIIVIVTAQSLLAPPRATILVFLLLILDPFLLITRAFRAQQMAIELNGTVLTRYFGEKGALSVVVGKSDASATMTFEYMDQPAWDAIHGKSHLSKPAWSAFGEIDGKKMRIVPRSILPD